MIENKNLQTIKIVQGDTLSTVFTLEDTFLTDISSATFVCKDLDLEVELIPANAESSEDYSSDSTEDYNNNGIPDRRWYLWYTGDTNDFRPGDFTYDFTIYIENEEQVFTMVYNGHLIVLPKRSLQHYNPYWEYPHNTKREH